MLYERSLKLESGVVCGKICGYVVVIYDDGV